MNDENDNFPMKIISRNEFSHSLLIKPREENTVDKIFLETAFAKRDIQRGESTHFKRTYHAPAGRIINFTIRDICEAFFDKYSGHTLANYFEKKAEPNSDLTKLIADLKFADEFYTKAFVINLTSGSGGRWEYWQLYIPGLESDEIKEFIPRNLYSKSKYSRNEIPIGHSPLLKKGISKDYYHKLRQLLGYKITEQEYFLSKVTSSRTAADTYYDYLKVQKPNNIDKTYLRFMKKWHNPIILIDNHRDKDMPIFLDNLTLQENFALTIYPIFYDNYPIPDGHTISIKPQNPSTTSNILEIFQSMYNLSELVLGGNLGLKDE